MIRFLVALGVSSAGFVAASVLLPDAPFWPRSGALMVVAVATVLMCVILDNRPIRWE
jgi:hypothetical protein